MSDVNVNQTALMELRTGAAIVKLENDNQMQIAIQRPRDLKVIRDKLFEELEGFPRMAHEAIFRKPVGGGNHAEGLSVRAAEHISSRYANAAMGVVIVGEDEDTVTQCATFLDYELNIKKTLMKITPKWYKAGKGRQNAGQMLRLEGDRLSLKVDADRSKIFREIVNRSVSPALKHAYEDECRRIRSKTPIEQRRKDLVEYYMAVFELTQKQLENREGKKLDDFGHTDIDNYVGMAHAAKSGEIDINLMFQIKKEEQEPDPPVKGEIDQEKLKGATATAGKRAPDPDPEPEKTGKQDPEPGNDEPDDIAAKQKAIREKFLNI